MAAQIQFFAGLSGSGINNIAGSGLGFYGTAGFGASVPVGQYQGRTFVTSSDGTVLGAEASNCQPSGASVAILGQSGSGIPLRAIPNNQATLNVRFTNDTPVRTQNATFTFGDRASSSNPASGIVAAIYEVSHQDTVQNVNGSGGPSTVVVSGLHQWQFLAATGTMAITLTASPGTSGLRPSGSSTVDQRHDWFLAVSLSPSSTGSKLSAGYVSLEYL